MRAPKTNSPGAEGWGFITRRATGLGWERSGSFQNCCSSLKNRGERSEKLMAGRTHSKETRRMYSRGLRKLLVVDGDWKVNPAFLPSLPPSLGHWKEELGKSLGSYPDCAPSFGWHHRQITLLNLGKPTVLRKTAGMLCPMKVCFKPWENIAKKM